ncbi:MAG TPA: preprotein translocase subunit SecE [Patescibacteria group bacterium]|nr:preprotein translocase subunit SecE [Patescibacteria group bacterium]
MTKPAQFLREVYDELKLVKWPKRRDVVNLTGVVILISVLVGLYIGGIDYLFTWITELIIK